MCRRYVAGGKRRLIHSAVPAVVSVRSSRYLACFYRLRVRFQSLRRGRSQMSFWACRSGCSRRSIHGLGWRRRGPSRRPGRRRRCSGGSPRVVHLAVVPRHRELFHLVEHVLLSREPVLVAPGEDLLHETVQLVGLLAVVGSRPAVLRCRTAVLRCSRPAGPDRQHAQEQHADNRPPPGPGRSLFRFLQLPPSREASKHAEPPWARTR